MATKWLSATLPAGTATGAEGGFPVRVSTPETPPTAAGLTAADSAGAAIIAITGDTYSNTTHQFTFGGATGLTHAQWAGASIGGALNTVLADLATANSNIAPSGQVLVAYDGTLTNNQLRSALRAILNTIP